MKNISKTLSEIMIVGFVICLLAFISFNCVDMPLDPVAPSSQISLQSIPIIDITKYMRELQESTKGINIDSTTGTISYVSTQTMPPQPIGDISVQPLASAQQVGVGQFSINAFSASQNYKASDLGFPANGSIPVPSGTISLAPAPVNDTTELDYIRIASGSLSLTITNNMPVPIDFPRSIVLRNNWSGPLDTATIAVFPVPGQLAANGGTTTIPNVSINGKILRGLLRTDSIQFHTPGSLPNLVTFSSSSGILVSLQSSPLLADSAKAKIPSQNVASINNTTFTVDDSTVVQDAAFKAGSFNILLTNTLGINVGVHFDVNDIVNASSGAKYAIDTILIAKQNATLLFDAKKWNIQTTPSLLGTKLKYSVSINTINSAGLKKTVTKNDFVSASIIPGSPFIVKSVTGKISTQFVQINSGMKSGIDLKDFKNLNGKFLFKGIGLIVRFPMGGKDTVDGLPMDYDLTVTSKSKGTILDAIHIKKGPGFPRIYPNNPVIPISNAPGFDNFLSNSFPTVPDSFYIRGFLTLDPKDEFDNSKLYSIHDTSKVYPALDVNIPFAAGVKNGTLNEMVSLGKDVIPKDITKNVGNGSLIFNFTNHLPIQVTFQARSIRYDSLTHKVLDTLLYIPKDTSSSYLIKPAQFDTTTNSVTTSTFSTFTVLLDNSDITKLNQSDSLYVRMVLNTSNDGKFAKVRDSDYIRVFAKGSFIYTVKPGE